MSFRTNTHTHTHKKEKRKDKTSFLLLLQNYNYICPREGKKLSNSDKICPGIQDKITYNACMHSEILVAIRSELGLPYLLNSAVCIQRFTDGQNPPNQQIQNYFIIHSSTTFRFLSGGCHC